MADVGAACPACGEPVAGGDAFCEACGHQIDAGAAAAPVEPEPAPEPAETADTDDGWEGPQALMARGVAAAAVARAKARSAEVTEEAPAAPAAAEPAEAVVASVLGARDSGTEGLTCLSCATTGQWFDGYCGVCGSVRPNPRDHTELDLPGVAAVSDKGRRHAKNEDAYAVRVSTGFVVGLVCDGVSTTVKPEDASQAAADTSADILLATGPSEPNFDGAFDAAREAVLKVEFQPHPDLGPPSCTYLASVITDGKVRLSAFGDCRGYWVSPDGAVQQLTVDDSWATQQILDGMDPGEAYADPRAHSITRWMARDADPAWRPVDITFEPPGPGKILLVSDGVWNYAAQSDQLAAVIAQAPPEPLGLARHLVDFANGAGGADNITAMVVDLPLHPAASDPAASEAP